MTPALSYLPADTSMPLLDQTVGGLLAAAASDHPDHLALVGTSPTRGEVRLTYAELLAEARRVAAGLRKLAAPGERVAIWAPNLVEWPIVEFGAALAGLVLVSINPAFPRPELEYAVRHSRATVLMHADWSGDYDMATVASEVGVANPGLQVVALSDPDAWCAAEPDPAVVAEEPTDSSAPVMLQYTSGTTGRPKGVLLRHHSLVNVARLTMSFTGVPDGAVCVNPLPMFHTAACVIGTLGPVSIAGTHILIERFAPDMVLNRIRAERANVLFHVPAVLRAVVDAQAASDQPAPHLDVVLGGASTVPPDLIEAAEKHFGAGLVTVFGQTELAPVLSATRSDDHRLDQLHSIGHPLPQVDVKIIDPFGNETVPLGVRGEICARGYQQLIEYVDDPEATSAALTPDGFVRTGDLGSMDERGYLTHLGRLKELIIRGGENISPAQIEACLQAHAAVAEAVVVGLPDQRLGEIVVAVLRLQDERPGVRAELEAYARRQLAPFKVPARWYVTEGLPVTATGKIRKFRVVEDIRAGRLQEL